MKTGISNSANARQESFVKRLRNRFSIFFIFVIFSSFVWVVIKLSKDFSSTVTYQIAFQNIPSGQILKNASDSTITVGIDAQGYNLINHHLWKKKPVVSIDLGSLKLQTGQKVSGAYLLTSELTNMISSQIGSGRELRFITPDTLRFEFLPEHKKQVPVIANIQYQLRPQFMLYDSVQVFPDSIWIYGPKEMLDTIFSVSTDPKSFSDLHENQQVTLSLKKPNHRQLTYSNNDITLNLKVENFTEIAFTLPVKIINSDNDYTLRIFPETVIVNCLVALKDYKRIDQAMFEASVSYKPADFQTTTKLRVELQKYPSYVRIARIEPERVEFILVKSTQ